MFAVLESNPFKVFLWDDNRKKFKGELKFSSEVKGIRCSRDLLVVTNETEAWLYNPESLQLLLKVDTGHNCLGLCGMATASDVKRRTIVLPSPERGSIKVFFFGKPNF